MKTWLYILLVLFIHTSIGISLTINHGQYSGHHREKRTPQFKFEDCGAEFGSGRDPIVQFLNVDVRPTPVLAPGPMYVSYLFNVTETLPETMTVDVTIQKYFGWLPVTVPCLESFGSCSYSGVCELLDRTFDPCNCPPALVEHNLPCTCPLLEGVYSLEDTRLEIPKITGTWSSLIEGEYKIKAKFINTMTKELLGCVQLSGVELELEKKKKECTGWFCDKRRHRRSSTLDPDEEDPEEDSDLEEDEEDDDEDDE